MSRLSWLEKGFLFSFLVALVLLLPGSVDAATNVTGTITLAERTSHLGTEVRFLQDGSSKVSLSRTTNGLGYFEGALASGNYKISIQVRGFSQVWMLKYNSFGDLTVVNDEALASVFAIDAEYNIPFDLDIQTVSVSGAVRLSNSATSEGSVVRFWSEGSSFLPDEATDGDGNYSVELLPGIYTVEIQPKGAPSVWLGSEVSGEYTVVDDADKAMSISIDSESNDRLDAAVQVSPITVSGTISLTGTASHAGTVLYFWPFDVVGASPFSPVNETDGDGGFSIDIVPGSYAVEIKPKGSHSVWLGKTVSGKATVVDSRDEAASFLIGVSSNQTINNTVTVHPVSVSGTVTRTGMDIESYAGTVVSFTPTEGGATASVSSATTDIFGDFTAFLPPGSYTVKLQVQGSSPLWLGRDGNGNLSVTAEVEDAVTLDFSVDTESNPVLDMSVESLSVSGTIELTGTASSEGTVVQFVTTGVEDASIYSATTDSDGMYSVELLPGYYGVSIQPRGSQVLWLGQLSAGQRMTVERVDQAVSLPIYTQSNQTVDLTVSMQPVSVSGTIALSGVAALEGTALYFFPPGSDTPLSFADATDSDGVFTLSLPPGVYTIAVQPRGSASVWLGLNSLDEPVVVSGSEQSSPFLIGNASNQMFALTIPVPPVSVSGSISTGAATHEGTVLRFLPVGGATSFSPSSPTDSGGEFSVSLPPGFYTVEMQPKASPSVWLGADTEKGGRTLVTKAEKAAVFEIGVDNEDNKTFDVYISPVAVTGIVKLNGTMSNEETAVRFWPVGATSSPASTDGQTDGKGAFSVDLSPGNYTVEIQPKGSASVWLGQGLAGTLTLENHAQDASSFSIYSGSNQTFSVTLSVPPVPVSGVITLSGVMSHAGTVLRFWPEGSAVSFSPDRATDGNGAFEASLMPGSYVVEIQPKGSVPVFLGRDDQDDLIIVQDIGDAKLFQVGSAFSQTFDVTVSVPPIAVSGTVTVGSETPAGSVFSFSPVGMPGAPVISGTTDSHGAFLANLTPGAYTLKIQPEGAPPVWLGQDDNLGQVVVGKELYASVIDIDVTVEAHPTFHVDIQPLLASGTVTLAGAATQEDIVLQFLPESVANASAYSASMESDGQFSVALMPGSYTVSIQPTESTSVWLSQNLSGEITVVDQAEHAFSFALDPQSNPPFSVVVPSFVVSGDVILAGEAAAHEGSVVHFFPRGDKIPLPDGVSAFTGLTDSEGHFSVTLIPGSYMVEVQPKAFASVWLGPDDTDKRTVVHRVENAHPFFVGPDANTTFAVDLTQEEQVALASLSGEIQVDGTAVSAATVRFWSASMTDPYPIERSTNTVGSYTASVPPDLYRIEVQLPGNASVFVGLDSANLVTVEKNMETAFPFPVGTASGWSTVDLDIPSERILPLVALTGTIREASLPAVDAKVRLWPASSTKAEPTEIMTNRVGVYTGQLVPGLYRVEIQLKDKSSVFVGVDTDGYPVVARDSANAFTFLLDGQSWDVINLDFLESDTVSLVQLSGTMLREGDETPVAGATVRLWATGGEQLLPIERVTDAQGNYVVALVPGEYRVAVLLPGKALAFIAEDKTYPQWPIHGFVAKLEDASLYEMQGASEELDITVRADAAPSLLRVHGQIQMRDAAEALVSVSGAAVRFKPVDAVGMVEVMGMTDIHGRYEMNVAPGSYTVEVQPKDAIPFWVGSDGTPAATSHLFEFGTEQRIDLTFEQASLVSILEVTVRGNIQKQGGTGDGTSVPAVGAKVYLESVENSSSVLEGVTDGQGNYAMDVAPGTYHMRVQVQGFDPVFVAQNQDGLNYSSEDSQQAFSFDLQAGAEGYVLDLVNAALAREKVVVSGKVTGPDGAAVAALRVIMQPEIEPNAVNNGVWVEGKTQEDGRFSLSVIPGRYRVEIQTKYWDGAQEVVVLGVDGEPANLVAGFVTDQSGTTPYTLHSDVHGATLFNVASAKTVDIRMLAGIALSGHVWKTGEGSAEDAIVGAGVHVRRLNPQGSFRAKTGEDGAFTVNVDPGKHYVIEVWPMVCDASDLECADKRENFMGGNLIVTDPSSLLVRNAQNEPVMTASLVHAADVTLSGKILGVWDSEDVTQFKMDQSLDLTLLIDKGQALMGKVLDSSGKGIGDAWVDSGLGGTSTDADGNFALVLPSSSNSMTSFTLHVWPPSCDPKSQGFADCEKNKVGFVGGAVTFVDGVYKLSTDEKQAFAFKSDGSDWPDEPAGLVVTTRSGAFVTGQVTDGTQGLSQVWVDAWSHHAAIGHGALTDADGYFSIPVESPSGAEAVDYEVGIWAPDYVSPEPVVVRVAAGANPEAVNFTLSLGHTVRGRVVDANSKGLPWIWVDLHDRQRTRFFGATTDEDGFYSVKVPEGQYVAVVWGNNENMRTTWYEQALDEKSATLVDVRTGDQSDVNFRLTSGMTIHGTVEGGEAGEKLVIRAWSEQTQSLGQQEVTLDAGGSAVFALSGLREAEDYRLEWSSDKHMDGFYGGTLGGDASGPVGREQAPLLDTRTGDIQGVHIRLNTGKTLTLVVGGISAGEKVEARMWSDTLGRGGWAEAVAEGEEVTLLIGNLDPLGTDYRLFVQSLDGPYRSGSYLEPLIAGGEGSLVGWEQATLIPMSEDRFVRVKMRNGAAISGTVSGLASGQVAWLDAFSEATHGWGGAMVVADAEGKAAYALKGLTKARDYRVSISGQGVMRGFYPGAGRQTLVRWVDAARVDIRTADATNIDLLVSSGVSLSGSVKGIEVDGGLKRGEWAWLDAWSDSTFSWAGVLVEADVENSGASVAYLLENLAPASDYQVYLSADGYVQRRKSSVDVREATTGVDFTLSTGGRITGSIRGLDASGLAWLEAFSPSTDSWGGVGLRADAGGEATYTIRGLDSADDYVVTLHLDGQRFFYGTDGITPAWRELQKVAVVSGTTEGIDFDLASAAGMVFTLSGRVTLDPVNEDQVVEIMAWSADGTGVRTSRVGRGMFTLKGLPMGEYTVEISSEGYVSQRTRTVVVTSGVVNSGTLAWTSSWHGTGVVSVASDTRGLDVTLASGVTLSGTVSLSTTGEALSGVWVNAWDVDGAVGSGAITDLNGLYSIAGLPQGTYTVDVWTPTAKVSQSVVLTEDQTVDLVVIKRSGAIRGSVQNVNGVAKQGVLVLVYEGSAQVAVTATDGSGDFKVEDLENGSYTIKVFGNDNFSTNGSYGEKAVTVSGSTAYVGTMQLTAPTTP